MVFDSLSELKTYVERAMETSAKRSAEEMLEIMREEISDAYGSYSPKVYDRTGDLENTPQIIVADQNGMTTEFMDNGKHVLIIYDDLIRQTAGQHFFALEGLEAGTSWGRGATNIYELSKTRCYAMIPDYYIRCMRALGIPIE